MILIDTLRDLLIPRNSAPSINAERLRIDKIKLEQLELRLRRDLENLQAQRVGLNRKLADCEALRDQERIARRIKDLDARAEVYDRHLDLVSEGLRVVDRCSLLAANSTRVREIGRLTVSQDLDAEKLEDHVGSVHLEERWQLHQFNELLDVMKAL